MIVGFDKVLKHAQESLSQKESISPAEHLRLFKKFLKIEDQRLAMQHRYFRGGLAVCQQRASLLDLLLQHIYQIALGEYAQGNPGGLTQGSSLIAVGGYGRGELNFHSDIDIMFLFQDKVDEFGKFLLNRVLYLLWDLGMTVGHSTRTIAQALEISSTDLVSRTALLESRFIAGDKQTIQHLQSKLENRFAKSSGVVQSYLAQKLREREERHAKFGSSMYLQEPNVKESLGGIRDLHNVLWALRLKYGTMSLSEALSHQLLTPREARSLENSYDFLLAVRNELHLCSGKKMDILTRAYQPKVATAFGYKDQGEWTAAELFMKKYYLHARTVAFVTASILSKLQETRSFSQRSLLFLRRKDLGSGLMQLGDTIYLAKPDPEIFAKDPLLILRIFAIAQQRGAKIHEDLKAVLRSYLNLVEKRFQNSQDAACLFREILCRPGSVGPVLRVMHEIGFLGKYIPEFGKITCHVQDSDYHRYTTDEHSLKAVEFLDGLYAPKIPVHPIIPAAGRALKNPELLYLALILHDIGKLDPEDHVSLGLAMAQKAMKRMGTCYSPQEMDHVLFLIREHLSMSHTAQRRDLDDPNTIMDFSVLVKNSENLQALLLLSYADANAVAPDIWTPWKEALVVELYGKTENWLAGRTNLLSQGPEVLAQTKKKVLELPGQDLSTAAVQEHLEKMPAPYLLFTPAELIAKHVRLANGLGQKPCLVNWEISRDNPSMAEVTICTRDRMGLFEIMAGCFTVHDINIVSAQVNTRADSIVLDTFRVSGSSENLPIDQRIPEKFTACLQNVLGGSLDMDTQVKKHEAQIQSHLAIPKKIAPVVLLDNKVSNSKTLLEVQAMDRLGLLYHICKVLAGLGCNICAAKISTERALAYDVFYITDRQGNKITDPQFQAKIISTLQAELAV